MFSVFSGKMSSVDEVEVMENLIKGCERFVSQALGQMKKELNAEKERTTVLEARVQGLETQVARLEAENSATLTVERVQSAFMAGMVALSNEGDEMQQQTAEFSACRVDSARAVSPVLTEIYPISSTSLKRPYEKEETTQ